MTTTIEWIVQERVDQKCRENGEYAQYLFEEVRRMNAGEYPQPLVDALCQKWHGDRRFNIYDACMFDRIVWHMIDENVLFRQLSLSGGPFADRAVEENNEILKQLPEGVKAIFRPETGGGANNDGSVEIHVPVRFFSLNKKEPVLIQATPVTAFDGSPRTLPLWFPLEVGTCPSWRCWFHLLRSKTLARWPYGSSDLHLFYVPLDRFEAFSGRLL
jgi:hypothetical protein